MIGLLTGFLRVEIPVDNIILSSYHNPDNQDIRRLAHVSSKIL
jgi:hypothetical protein